MEESEETVQSGPEEAAAAEIGAHDIDGSFVPRRRGAVAIVELDGEAVLFDEATGTTHLLDQVATVVWKCFDGSGSVDELVEDLAAAFGAPRDVVAGDVLELARQAGGNGLLEGVARARPELVSPPRPASVPEGSPVPAFDYPGVGGRVALAQHRGREVLLVNWSATCGFCDGIVGDLAEAVPLLAEKGVDVVVVSTGTEETHLRYREQGLAVPIALADDFELFTGVGTPAAYLLDGRGTVASPLSVGALEVPGLVRRLAGLPEITQDAHEHHGHDHHAPHQH